MIRLTDVQKEYENGTHALRGVTMEVNGSSRARSCRAAAD